MQTTVKELPGSRVEVEVEVPAGDVEKGVNRAARSLAREMRLPGFRKGKAPPSLVIQRLGFGPVLEEAIRDSLPDWYERALLASKVISVGDPSVEIVSTPEAEGEPLGFKFEIGVRPEAKLGEYKGLEVGRAETEVPEDIVDREIERIREGFAKLEPVERPAADGRRAADRLRGPARRQGVRGRGRHRLSAGAGQRPPDRGLRGAADRRRGRRRAHGRGHLPRRLRGRAARRQGRRLQRRGQGGARKGPARARRRLRRRGVRVRHAGRAEK